eukprot:scaffold740_cov405-Prasinococcus_capsulatus_cf.AAC.6
MQFDSIIDMLHIQPRQENNLAWNELSGNGRLQLIHRCKLAGKGWLTGLFGRWIAGAARGGGALQQLLQPLLDRVARTRHSQVYGGEVERLHGIVDRP